MKKQNTPPKAYRNREFLNGPDARTIRILAEYHEPRARFQKYDIKDSIVFFGSSRSMDLETAKKTIQEEKKTVSNISNDSKRYRLRLAEYYDEAVELSHRLTEWSIDVKTGKQKYYICSGGGPGMMEAANKGAQLAGGKSIGLNISIPTEQFPNPYISKELSFEFHYFFIRKFWFAYLAKALVIFPGGFGTLDELMEGLTLIQTGKITKKLPIVLYGKEYWDEVLNIDAMVKWGTLVDEDVKLLHFSDEVEDAYQYLIKNMVAE